jgi:hypothetical protein
LFLYDASGSTQPGVCFELSPHTSGWFEGGDLLITRCESTIPTPWTPSHPISIMQLEVEAVWVAGLLTLGELTLLMSDALRYLYTTIVHSLIP